MASEAVVRPPSGSLSTVPPPPQSRDLGLVMDPYYPLACGQQCGCPTTMLGQREIAQLQQPWRAQNLVHALCHTPLDVKENHDVIVMMMDTPGVTKDAIKVRLLLSMRFGRRAPRVQCAFAISVRD